MNKYLFILTLTLSFWGSLALHAQSVFDDYGSSITNLNAMPYASLDLDAMDYNSAGNVFLRNGVELSLSSLWPRWQTISNTNTFKVRDYTISRSCEDRIKLGIPNPSARISWCFNDNALAFSYSHAESHFEGNGNAFLDDVIQRSIGDKISIIQSLNSLSDGYCNQNENANFLSSLFSILYGVDVPAPFAVGTEFPLAILSTSTEYGCASDKFSIGYSHSFSGSDEMWERFSVYGGLKAQRMALSSSSLWGLFFIEQGNGMIYPYADINNKFANFYYQLADSVPVMSDYFTSMGQSYENMTHFADSAFATLDWNSYHDNKWGFNAEIGFNLVRPYWNLAVKAELGSLPFRFGFGYSRYVGHLQLSFGGDFGFAFKKFGIYSELFGKQSILFGQQVGKEVKDYCYGDVGFEVAGHVGECLTLRGGVSCGFNKDVLVNSGSTVLLKKNNSLSASCGVRWNLSSLLSVVGGFKFLVPCPCGKMEYYNDVFGYASYTVGCECQFSIGFVAHLE